MLGFRMVSGLALILALAGLLAGCGSKQPISPTDQHTAQPELAPVSFEVPFPLDEPATHLTAATGVDTLPGKLAYKRSPNAAISSENLVLTAAAGELSYGAYRFSGLADEDELIDVDIEFIDPMPDTYYLGLADFNSKRWVWQLRGSRLGSSVSSLGLKTGSGGASEFDSFSWPIDVQGISPSGSAYVAIALWDDASTTIFNASLTRNINDLAPVASFTADPTHGNAALGVTLDATASFDRDGVGIVDYQWDLDGDGLVDVSEGPAYFHTYPEPGIYHPRLLVIDGDGLVDEASLTVSVHDWAHTWGGEQQEWITSMTRFNDGLYTLGPLYDPPTASDYLVARFDLWGQPIWQRTYGGDGFDLPTDIVTAADSSLVVTGETKSFGLESKAILTASFNPSGGLNWERVWDTSGIELGPSATTDGTGNVYVAFHTNGLRIDGKFDLVVIKYSPTGDLLWQKKLSATGLHQICCIGRSASAIIVASTYQSTGNNYLAVLKLDLAGSLVDQATIKVAEFPQPNALSVDVAGNIYISGTYNTAPQQAYLVKLNSSLDAQWFRTWGVFESSCQGLDLKLVYDFFVVDQIYVATEMMLNTPNRSNAALLSYDTAGLLTGTKGWLDATKSNYLTCFATGLGGATLLGGAAQNNNLVRSDVPGITTILTFTNGEHTALISDIEGISFSPAGVLATPSGVLDTGGGEDDLLVLGLDLNDL